MIQQYKDKYQVLQQRFLRPTHLKRFIFFVLADALIIIFSLYFSFLLRLDFKLKDPYLHAMYFAIPSFLVVKLMSFAYFKLYKLSWRFVSLKDFYNIIKAVIFSSLALMIGIYFFRLSLFQGFPRGVLAIDAVITLFLVAFLRVSKRIFFEVLKGPQGGKGKRTIIVGAGNTGEMILRDLQKNNFKNYTPIVFLDDDLNLIGTYLHGIKVAGKLEILEQMITNYSVEAVIIAIPALSHVRLLEIYKKAKEAGVKEIKIVPRIYDFYRPEIHIQALEDIKIEDLIGRQVVNVDYQEIGRSLEDKIILITGAGGSIGFELALQICRFNPRELILFEIDETELYHAEIQLKREFPELVRRVRFLVGDIRDSDKLQLVFKKYKPEIVFHAAAYKHVPLMEYNVAEAVKVNIIGTYNLVQISSETRVKRFIMISTDKAVMPTSIMGATKRMAEYICQAFNKLGFTEYVSVRFGNVLGSRGSVLPLFLEQIQKGGPITITHQDMKRYFMTIPEAVSLVLQASVVGRGGDIMALDMGEPVKIIELAEELLRLHGLRPNQDIKIELIGLRPGEKLFENILTAEEGTIATRHEKIFIARTEDKYSFLDIEKEVVHFQELAQSATEENEEAMRLDLKRLIKWYGTVDKSSEVRPGEHLSIPLLLK